MKRILRIILGAALGGLLGSAVGIGGVLWIANFLYGPKLEQGALVVFVTGPVCALLGLIAGGMIAFVRSSK